MSWHQLSSWLLCIDLLYAKNASNNQIFSGICIHIGFNYDRHSDIRFDFFCHGQIGIFNGTPWSNAELFLVLEFQTRFWFPKTTPARASVRGLEFDSGLFETEARRRVAAS